MLLRKIAVARFTRTWERSSPPGVPISRACPLRPHLGHAVLEEALMKVRKAIEEGRHIIDPLRESGRVPNMVTQ